MINKALMLLIGCSCFAGQLIAQDSLITWEEHRKSISEREDKSYIMYSSRLGGQNKKVIFCFIEDSMQVVALGMDGQLRKEFLLHQPGLFDLVYDNMKELLKLRDLVYTPHFISRKKFIQLGSDPHKEFIQVSIKYGNLHYNHFFPKDIGEISIIKNKNIRQAYLVINQIREVLLKSVQ
jgi:hypothetical protein